MSPLSPPGRHGPVAPVAPDTALRRLMDVLLSVPALLVLAPVLAATALLVKISSPGPVLFTQWRAGRRGRPFRLVKFRSMVADAARLGPGVSGQRDPRVTGVGRVLRATKIDELPQLLNVLRGDMTLIGPRPELPEDAEHYGPEEREILAVRPGLTSPGTLYWTTHQARELDGADDPHLHYRQVQMPRKLAVDLEYLRHRTLGRDLSTLWRTLLLVLGAGRGSRA